MANTINATALTPIVAGAITSDYQVTIYDQAGNAGRANVADVVSAGQAVSGCLCVQTAKMVIPTAEVLTLNSVPKVFGITVPAGYFVQPIEAIAQSAYAGTQYATNISLRLRAVGASNHMYALNLNYTADLFTQLGFQAVGGIKYVGAADIEVYVDTGDPTAGDSDITIYLTYVLIEL
jgi:hypothetical protein